MSRTAYLGGASAIAAKVKVAYSCSSDADRLRSEPAACGPGGPARTRSWFANAISTGSSSGPEPGELLDVVGGDGLALAADDPRQAEHEVAVVRVEERPDPLDRLDLEPGLLEELAPQTVERLLALLEEPARRSQYPFRGSIFRRPISTRPSRTSSALHRGRRVRPVRRAAAGQPRCPPARGSRARGRSAGRPASRRGGPHAASLTPSTASESRGHASFAQSPNSRSVRHASASPASGSTQRNVPLRPKWPNVRGELRAPVQCGLFASRSSRPSPQSFGSMPAEARQHAAEARELHGRRLGERLAARSASARAARARPTSSALERRLDPVAPAEPASGKPQTCLEVRRRTASRPARRRARRAPRSRCSSRCAASRAARAALARRTAGPTRARAGGAPSSRAGRPARRARRSPPPRRRARRPLSRASSPTPTRTERRARRTTPRPGRRRRRPRGRTATRRLAAEPPRVETTGMDRQHISSGAAFEERVGYSRAVRVGPPGLGLRHRADHARRRRSARRRLRAGADLPRDHRAGARPRPAPASTTSSARASTSRAPSTSTRSAAPTARLRAARPGDDGYRRRAARSALAGRDRGRGRYRGASMTERPSASSGSRERARPQLRRRAPRTRSASRRSTCCSTPRPGISSSASTRARGASPTGEFEARINAELMQSVLEITTPVCRKPGRGRGAPAHAARATSPEIARNEGCPFGSAGTHPFSLFERQRITARDRYRQLVDQFQYIARRELIFGMHIHAAVDDPDKAIQVVERPARPPARVPRPLGELAVLARRADRSASSRQMVFSAFPRSGVPPRFASYEEFAEVVGQLERTGCIADYTHIWWDVRPAPAARHGRAARLRRRHAGRGRRRARRATSRRS